MPDEVFYYCSAGTLLSILKNREIWLTSLPQSNDKLEGTWAVRHYLESFRREDRNRMWGAKTVIDGALDSRVAVGMCFSESRDLLSQWRGYASDGKGFSIGFSLRGLKEFAASQAANWPGISLQKVKYGPMGAVGLNKIIYGAFKQGIEGFQFNSEGIGSVSLDYSGNQHEIETTAVSALYEHKSDAFKEELEWRLFVVQFPSRLLELEFRENKGVISPFARLKVDISLVKSITLGPSSPNTAREIKWLARRHDFNPDVLTSSASYVSR